MLVVQGSGTTYRKRFYGETAGAARKKACDWLGDFTLHKPLKIDEFATLAIDHNEFATTITVFDLEGSHADPLP